jgi:CheY-like chemotaxis protein
MIPTAQDSAATGEAEHLNAVLLVEDDSNDFLLAQRELRKLKLLNPLRHVGTVEEMAAYMSGEGKYQDRVKYPLPQVILLDMHLAMGDGLDAAAWLRSKLKFRNIPIVAISGSGTERLNMAVDMGAHALMLKPFRAEEFLKVVKRLQLQLVFEAD